jgi:hypothetical protein
MTSPAVKRKLLIKQIIVYVIMILAVLLIVSFITFFMLGFRFDADKGNLEQYALMQFNSSPSSASVVIDGKEIGLKTPSKKSVPAGKYQVEMWRDGYETWTKSVDIKSGAITWLNYALLVPKKLTVEPVENYESVYSSLASPKGEDMIIKKQSDTPTFSLVDLNSDTIKSTILTIPTTLYSESTTVGVIHSFDMDKWDEEGRYVLIRHKYNDQTEWLVLDTQNVNLTRNINQLFNVAISNVVFSGTSGNVFYALDANNICKLDLDAVTISAPLVSNVTNFEIYNKSKIITYVGSGQVGTNERVVGLYREGDIKPSVIRTVTSSPETNLRIATTRYFNANYVAILDGTKVDILSGSYPDTTNNHTSAMEVIASFQTIAGIERLSFSPTGAYVFVQSGAYFASYDLEYQKFVSGTVEGSGPILPLKWLDDNYVWSGRDGKLTIREYDGSNVHTINSVLADQDATMTSNGRYIYSLNKIDTTYQLQRVRMILR